MNRRISALAAAVAALSLAQAADHSLVRLQSFPLDAKLREVSGLAIAGPNSVFAHGDEYAIIHEVSLKDGSILRSFALGKPTAQGDFEGIVKEGAVVWLVTSDGRLYEAPIAAHGRRTRFNVYDTGVGAHCEVEGLAHGTPAGEFYLLCKQILGDASRNLRIYRWSIEERFTPQKAVLDVPLAALLPEDAAGDFHPSDLFRNAKTGAFSILSVSGGILDITADGALMGYTPLDRKIHLQPEGLTITGDGRLLIADEGGARAGRLTIYERR